MKEKKSVKKTRSTASKIESLLDVLPNFLKTANEAAEAHTKALAKWQKKQGLLSEEEEED